MLWNIMIDMGVPKQITLLIRTLYENQTATVETSYGLSDFFNLDKESGRAVYCPQVYLISSLNKY